MDLTEKELKEALDILKHPIMINNQVYKYFDEKNYERLKNTYLKCLDIYNKLDTLIEISKEHKILKQFIIDNGMWEKLLNDEKFLEWMREDE